MSRVQLALNVTDLDASVAFYSTMFGVEPHKRRPGYANFIVEVPPLKLVLIEVPADQRGTGTQGALNHLGVEVESVDQVAAHAERLQAAGLATFDEVDTTCCYALQDKVWVHDPAGAPWEVYTVKDDNPADALPATASLTMPAEASAGAACCTPGSAEVPQPAATAAAAAPPADTSVADPAAAPAPAAESPRAAIRVFEPALCCNTGVCGPDVDDSLVAFTADLGALQGLGIDIERHNLANDPGAFAANQTVREFLREAGSEGLPLTMVDGVIVMTGTYPARDQLLAYARATGPVRGAGHSVATPTTTAGPAAISPLDSTSPAPIDVVPAGASTLGLLQESGACCGGGACC